jgi:hypothetical protein
VASDIPDCGRFVSVETSFYIFSSTTALDAEKLIQVTWRQNCAIKIT